MAGTRAQQPQQEASEHAAASRPETNSASGAKRRRRRRHARRDESDDDDDDDNDEDHAHRSVVLAALPRLPSPVSRLGQDESGQDQSATPPPPLPGARGAAHAPLLFLGKKPMSERRLVVGSLAWRQKMAHKSDGVLTSFQSLVRD